MTPAPWRRWFAWHPIDCAGRWTWLRTVERRERVLDSYGHRFVDHDYRPLSPSSNPIPHGKRDGGGL